MPLDEDVDMERLAEETKGYVGSDIEHSVEKQECFHSETTLIQRK